LIPSTTKRKKRKGREGGKKKKRDKGRKEGRKEGRKKRRKEGKKERRKERKRKNSQYILGDTSEILSPGFNLLFSC
jgi:hypothetical protein